MDHHLYLIKEAMGAPAPHFNMNAAAAAQKQRMAASAALKKPPVASPVAQQARQNNIQQLAGAAGAMGAHPTPAIGARGAMPPPKPGMSAGQMASAGILGGGAATLGGLGIYDWLTGGNK